MATGEGNQSYLQALQQHKPLTTGTQKAVAMANPSTQPSASQPTAKDSQQPGTTPPTFQDLSPQLQALVLALGSAPFNTCKAASLIAADNQLVALWLLRSGRQHPLLIAAMHRLWGVCEVILQSSVTSIKPVLYAAIRMAAAAGQEQLVSRLLQAPGGPLVDPIEQDSREHSSLKASLSLANSF
jgi:hypothetical protein